MSNENLYLNFIRFKNKNFCCNTRILFDNFPSYKTEYFL